MILRRFMQHVKEQNWFAVGLDVIVVIVGIFLGMQVQQWYEDRKSVQRDAHLVKNIVEDLRLDTVHINRALIQLTDQLEVADSMLARALDADKALDYQSAGLIRYSSDFRPIVQRNHSEAVSNLKSEYTREILQNYFLKEDQVRDIFLEYEYIVHHKVRPYLREVGMHNINALQEASADALAPVFLLPEVLDEQLNTVKFQQLLFERRLKTGTFNLLLKELRQENLKLIGELSINNHNKLEFSP